MLTLSSLFLSGSGGSLLLLAAFGLALLVGCGQILWEERRRALPALLPLITVVLFFVVWNFGGANWVEQKHVEMRRREEQVKFDSMRSKYEDIISRIKSGKLQRSGEDNGIPYQSDQTNPQLVSFIEDGGMLDNYTAIVYDPTDIVMRANKFKGDFSNFDDPSLSEVKMLFGGCMFWATPLGKHWYRCGFT